MSYWDTSALVKLFVEEIDSGRLRALAQQDAEPSTSWLTRIECWSALARLAREGVLTPAQSAEVRQALAQFYMGMNEIEMSEPLRAQAGRLLRIHPLRAGDAIHLVAALVWAGPNPDGQGFVCLDERLGRAAALEGFWVLPAPDPSAPL